MSQQTALEIIYVVSNPAHARLNLYKIGRHTGGFKKLITRYSTAIPNVIVYCAHDVPPSTSPQYEKSIHKKLDKHRLVDNGKSEWFEVELPTIINTILVTLKEPLPKKGEVSSSSDEEDMDPKESLILASLKEFMGKCMIKKEEAKTSISEVRGALLSWSEENYELVYLRFSKRGGIKKLTEELDKQQYNIGWSGKAPYLRDYVLRDF